MNRFPRSYFFLLLALPIFSCRLPLIASLFSGKPMILVFDTRLQSIKPPDYPGKVVGLSLQGKVDIVIDWGDGMSESVRHEGRFFHGYANDGEYTVRIKGRLEHLGSRDPWGEGNPVNAHLLRRVVDFGNLGLRSLKGAFYSAVNLVDVPDALPGSVTDLSYAFALADSFNDDVNRWDVSRVTEMHCMFWYAERFNSDIGGWNTGNVRHMSYMFSDADSFDQDIGKWDAGNVTDMGRMFYGAYRFNQDIGRWNVGGVLDMNQMFRGAAEFCQDLNAWKVSQVKYSGQFGGRSGKWEGKRLPRFK